MNILNKWFLIDLLKLLSRVGVLVVFLLAALIITTLRSTLSLTDVLLILATGMILGAVYVEIQRLASDYLDKQSMPS